ncbi:hypothetical protein ACH437_26160 [Streptomyces xinghaiensis]|uniref:hypothetical protein n=1 Tax=Streptomyces xinghaiensis TaxID=1038928 RepID=UPI0037930F7B
MNGMNEPLPGAGPGPVAEHGAGGVVPVADGPAGPESPAGGGGRDAAPARPGTESAGPAPGKESAGPEPAVTAAEPGTAAREDGPAAAEAGDPDAPAGPAPLGVPRTPTGNAGVDAALDRLADVDHLPGDGHIEVYEDVHRALRDTLTALDQRPGPPGPSPTPSAPSAPRPSAPYDTRS